LSQILAYADEHAPALDAARAEKRLGDAEMRAATVLLRDNPALEASAGPKLDPSGRQGLEIEVSLTQAVEIANPRSLRIDAAQAQRKLHELGYRRTRWAVHRQVHEAFHYALLARERARVARHVHEFAAKLDQVTRRQLEAGEVSQVEARLAAGELAQARQARVAAEGQARLARIRLAEVSGWPASTPPRVDGQLDGPRRPPALKTLVQRAEKHNPELLTRKQAAAVSRAEVRVAGREAWPTPEVGVAYGHERDPGEADGVHIGLVTLGLGLPLWNRNQGERARAAARAEIALAQQQVAAQRVKAELAHAHAAADVAARRIEAFGSEVIPAFEGNLALLERAYELGEIDLLRVMVARGRFLDIEREALSAYDDYFASVARLEALLGAEVWEDASHGDPREHEEQP
jgi:cobalt-zinc-cadmium efflux system outer membrane protein